MKKFEQTIPKEQMAIVKDALVCYQQTLIVANRSRGESGEASLEHPIFDIHALIGLLDREVTVVLTQDEVDGFGKYGVDFPEYIGEPYRLKEITSQEKLSAAMTKLAYFAHNFPWGFIEDVWGVGTHLGNHLQEKYRLHGDFWKWYMNLSDDNKDMLNEYVLNNYKGMPSLDKAIFSTTKSVSNGN